MSVFGAIHGRLLQQRIIEPSQVLWVEKVEVCYGCVTAWHAWVR
jgi:hypothetical protein